MLQRNVSGGVLLLPTLDPPIEVPAGGEIDHPEPLAGFIPVEDAPAVTSTGKPDPADATPKAPPPTTAASTTSSSTGTAASSAVTGPTGRGVTT